MAEEGKSPKVIVKERNLEQVSDTGLIQEVCQKVLAQNPGEVEAYRGGKKKLFGFFVGEVMKQSQGKLNPGQVNDVLQNLLKG
jgi:aspartyl-tRNA(Asn)/glutamyl-tRNA(Gln) amidotransferase subunit B